MIPTHVQIVGKVNQTDEVSYNEVSYIVPRDKVTLLRQDFVALDPTVKPTTNYSAFIERSGSKSVRISMEYDDWFKASRNLQQT